MLTCVTWLLKRKLPALCYGHKHRSCGAFANFHVLHSGLFAIKDYRDAISQDDFNKAVRKVAESKKLEGKLEYQKL